MHERVRNANFYRNSPKTESDFSLTKTAVVLVIVVACFAILWPKVFYPILVGSAQQYMKPSDIDKTTGCCDVISETDVNTIKIMSELCGNIIHEKYGDQHLTGKEIVQVCRKEVWQTCEIDISAILQEQVRLGQSVKEILNEIRSLNGSLCLKYNFGVPTGDLGVTHNVILKYPVLNIQQERSSNIRDEMLHPAFRERGRAIPQTSRSSAPPKIIEGRPGPIPGMRPTMGGPGHIVQSKQSTGSMGIIMPLYTIGIVIFFTYTLMKIFFKKHPDITDYNAAEQEEYIYSKEALSQRNSNLKDGKLVVNAMSALLDEVDQELEARRKASQNIQNDQSSNLLNGTVKKEEDLPTVKIMGMETQASCEDNKKWTAHDPNVTHNFHSSVEEIVTPPKEIYLEGSLPPQSQILVSDSTVETEKAGEDESAVILSGKMTLSVVNIDGENEDVIQNVEKPEKSNLLKDEIIPTVENLPISPKLQEVNQTINDNKLEKNIEQHLKDFNQDEVSKETESSAKTSDPATEDNKLQTEINEVLKKTQDVQNTTKIGPFESEICNLKNGSNLIDSIMLSDNIEQLKNENLLNKKFSISSEEEVSVNTVEELIHSAEDNINEELSDEEIENIPNVLTSLEEADKKPLENLIHSTEENINEELNAEKYINKELNDEEIENIPNVLTSLEEANKKPLENLIHSTKENINEELNDEEIENVPYVVTSLEAGEKRLENLLDLTEDNINKELDDEIDISNVVTSLEEGNKKSLENLMRSFEDGTNKESDEEIKDVLKTVTSEEANGKISDNDEENEELSEEEEIEYEEEIVEVSDDEENHENDVIEENSSNVHRLNGQAHPVVENESSEEEVTDEEEVEEEEIEIEYSEEEIDEDVNNVNNHIEM